MKAAVAGKHIFCEKPIHTEIAKIKEALEAVEKAGVKLQVGFVRRFDRSHKAVRDVVASGKLGKPYVIKVGARVIGASEQSYSIQGKAQPILEGKYVMNDDEWETLTKGLSKLGRVAKDMDMTLTFHHHMGTVVQTEEEIDRFMDMVDPNYVYLLFDSGHCSYADIDPVKVLGKYIGRTRHIHLKDLRRSVVAEARANKWSFLEGVRKGTFTVPGDGDVDFEPLFKIIQDADYEGWVVVEAEQDPALANPFEYALKARKYIAEHTGL